jgi:RNA polymerase sigma factor (sigma-70 family)
MRMKMEEDGTLSEKQPLPSMIELYRRDMLQCPEDSNLDLPVRIAYTVCAVFPGYWPHFMDFIQEGNLELLRCKKVFPEKHPSGDNDQFRNYAAKCIRGVIYHYFSRIQSIYIPTRSRRLYFVEKGREDELFLLEHCVSFEELYDSLLEIEEPTNMEIAFCEAKRQQVHALLAQLPTKERQAMMMRYGIDGATYEFHEIAQELDVCTKQAYGIVRLATRRLNGTYTKPPKEFTQQEDTRKRNERLHTVYEQYQGKINRETLAHMAGCGVGSAARFIRDQRKSV